MSHYIHGTGPEEQERLARMNTILLNGGCIKELSLKGGEKILDVGSGLGQFTREMAKAAGTVVLGIERSEEQIRVAVNQAQLAGEGDLVKYRLGDARHLPLQDEEWGTFDVVHTRFVLEHVPDPLNVVREMIRAVKKGGRVILADDDHDIGRIYPEVTGFAELWNAYMETYRASGNDPVIGRKLVSFLCEAGAQPVRNSWVFFGSCAGHPSFDVYIDNILTVIAQAKEQMVQQKLFDERKFNRIMISLQEWRQRPDASLWYAVSWAEGIK